MTVVTPKFGMGASVLRREDAGLHPGPGPLYRRHPAGRRPARLCLALAGRQGKFHHRFDRGGQGRAGRPSGADRQGSRPSRRSEIRRHAEAAGRHQGADPRHSDPVPRPRQLCRRRRRLRRRRQPRAGAGRRRTDRGRLRQRRCRLRHRDGACRRHAAGLAGTRLQPRLHLSHGRQGQDRGGFRQGRSCHPHRIHQQPAGLQLHGAALGDRRVEGR